MPASRVRNRSGSVAGDREGRCRSRFHTPGLAHIASGLIPDPTSAVLVHAHPEHSIAFEDTGGTRGDANAGALPCQGSVPNPDLIPGAKCFQ
jgi:hypothetical protein